MTNQKAIDEFFEMYDEQTKPTILLSIIDGISSRVQTEDPEILKDWADEQRRIARLITLLKPSNEKQ